MSTALTPLNFLSGIEALDYLQEDWRLDNAPHGAPARTFRSRVVFERPFAETPLVHLGIVGLDASGDDATRITARTENVSREGFDLVLATWLHSRLWKVDVSWLALGP